MLTEKPDFIAWLKANPELLTGLVTPTGSCISPLFRFSFPYVFNPQEPNAENGLKVAKYSVTALFTELTDLSLMRDLLMRAAAKKFGADQAAWPPNMKTPIRDQGEKKFEGFNPGSKMTTFTSRQRPETLDASGKAVTDELRIYPGVWGRVSFNAFAYDKSGNRGVAFGLNNVQILRDDDPLAGRPRANAEFQPVATPVAAMQESAAPVTAANIFG